MKLTKTWSEKIIREKGKRKIRGKVNQKQIREEILSNKLESKVSGKKRNEVGNI